MKFSLALLSSVLVASCNGIAFERPALFGVPRGGASKKNDDAHDQKRDDYEAAEQRIFEAEKHAVEVVADAIEDEVDTIYHEMPHHEKDGSEKKKPVKVAKKSDDGEERDDYEVAEDKIFHAVENAEKKVLSAAHKAEKAVEHAIEQEVETIFPPGDNKES